jgi:DNA ligase-1
MIDYIQLNQILVDLNSSNSSTFKSQELAKHNENENFKKLLIYAYDPYRQYFVSRNQVKKHQSRFSTTLTVSDIFEVLDLLETRTLTGFDAVKKVLDVQNISEVAFELILKCLDKDLGIRMGDSLINKVFPNLIPTFDVALAKDYETKLVDFSSDMIFSSRKLDGVRCLTVIDSQGLVSTFSRAGNKFETLAKVEEEIALLGLKDTVLDGEICLIDDEGNDDFAGTMSEIRRKDHIIQKPKYLIFDILSGKEFRDKKGNDLYSTRLNRLLTVFAGKVFQHLSIVQQNKVTSEKDIQEQLIQADADNWEGLILRKNVPYEGKRSKSMLKCKTFTDAEYVVKGVEIGPFRKIVQGKEVTIQALTNILIEHKGNTVSVGSGFSLQEREYFRDHPEEIVGKIVTVKYFEETLNQNGQYSLRFPTLKVIHGDKREL